MSTGTVLAPYRGGEKFRRIKKEYGIYDALEMDQLVETLPSAREHLIDGLIPARSVNILVGESGLGKSPLGYQMALAIATGRPFLGMPTREGRVIYIDYENSPVDARWMMRQQAKHLGIAEIPFTFQLWPLQLNPMQERVDDVIAMFAPDFVVIDSLRSFNPKMESDNVSAVACLRSFRQIAAERRTAFLFIHHLRKSRNGASRLDECDTMTWLAQAAGVRALINQTDVRLAVGNTPAGLTMRGHFRTRGEVGPFLLDRKWSGEDDEPLGYERRYVDAAMLENTEQQECFARLPESFRYEEARVAYGKSSGGAHLFLEKLIRLGLARKVAYGKYCKTGGAGFDLKVAEVQQDVAAIAATVN